MRGRQGYAGLRRGPTAAAGIATPLSMTVLFAVLFAAWLLWSGFYKPLLISLGLFSCALTLWLARRFGVFKDSTPLLTLLPRLPGYWVWLIREIVLSSLKVSRLALSPTLTIRPTVVRLKAEAGSDVGRVILGNAITLSPGTVTLDVDDDELLVHCLTAEGASALEAGDVVRRTAALESSRR